MKMKLADGAESVPPVTITVLVLVDEDTENGEDAPPYVNVLVPRLSVTGPPFVVASKSALLLVMFDVMLMV